MRTFHYLQQAVHGGGPVLDDGERERLEEEPHAIGLVLQLLVEIARRRKCLRVTLCNHA